jgi:hypothetical protein
LNVMVAGLQEELDMRMQGVLKGPPEYLEPSVDSDGYFMPESANDSISL